MPKVVDGAVKIEVVSEKTYGQCSACLEMTSLEDPCCPFAGVLVDGQFVRAGDKPHFTRKELEDELNAEIRDPNFVAFALDSFDDGRGEIFHNVIAFVSACFMVFEEMLPEEQIWGAK